MEVLIISSLIDYSTDLICYELEKRSVKYLRLNRDSFLQYKITYNLNEHLMTIIIEDTEYTIVGNELRSVYFRAPVFLREKGNRIIPLEEQVYRSQWYAFIRNLIVFDKALWVNNPFSTYRAENKLFQLRVAQQAGLAIPNTSVTNNSNINLISDEQYIVKSLDTALFYKDKQEMFTYSNMVCGKDINSSNLQNAPVIIQNYLPNKVDLRVSIVGGELFPIKILTKQNENIVGDWRKTKKDELSYIPVDLPQLIQDKILNVMKQLELNFGGLDLICSNGEYYFIEVNPTGEWGWLVSNAKLPIDKKITDLLLN